MIQDSISVITANLNTIDSIPRLADSLNDQTDLNFTWIIVDGGSTDGSVEWVRKCNFKFNINIIEGKDFGIYDAINKGIRSCVSNYYLVAGADDILSSDAIENFKNTIRTSKADIITATVKCGDNLIKAKGPTKTWLYGQSAFLSNHSVGIVIKMSLHKELGYYTNRFPIAADQLFLMKCQEYGKKINEYSFIAGRYNLEGTSSLDRVGSSVELFRIQIELKRNYFLQLLLLVYRLIKFKLIMLNGRG